MPENRNVLFDNEYTIMSEIAGNERVTQRELSKKMGVSVSTVNVLINKMIREGLIKMTQVSQKQVLYMLTPAGMMEKTKKTVSYIKAHYRVIYETKEKIKGILGELSQTYDTIFVWVNDHDMKEIIHISIDEFEFFNVKSKIIIIENEQQLNMKEAEPAVLIYMEINKDDLKKYVDSSQIKRVDLAERLYIEIF
ncbi:MAG: winged helix-turn-helix transcriptional regulator [Lacrimispora sp.]|uniref:winged helix-turn-helix transcriptional regulator n=1 Tax=Lacrimispora sp. TaxID=2719234 RepID=UPI0039E47CC3